MPLPIVLQLGNSQYSQRFLLWEHRTFSSLFLLLLHSGSKRLRRCVGIRYEGRLRRHPQPHWVLTASINQQVLSVAECVNLLTQVPNPTAGISYPELSLNFLPNDMVDSVVSIESQNVKLLRMEPLYENCKYDNGEHSNKSRKTSRFNSLKYLAGVASLLNPSPASVSSPRTDKPSLLRKLHSDRGVHQKRTQGAKMLIGSCFNETLHVGNFQQIIVSFYCAFFSTAPLPEHVIGLLNYFLLQIEIHLLCTKALVGD